MTRIGLSALALLAVGCAAEPGALDQALSGGAQTLPSCTEVTPPAGRVAVEQIGDQLVVWFVDGPASTPLCAGPTDQVLGSGVLDRGSHKIVPLGKGDPAASDPMPADGRLDPAASDPMPADGRLDPASSDPMPADGRHGLMPAHAFGI